MKIEVADAKNCSGARTATGTHPLTSSSRIAANPGALLSHAGTAAGRRGCAAGDPVAAWLGVQASRDHRRFHLAVWRRDDGPQPAAVLRTSAGDRGAAAMPPQEPTRLGPVLSLQPYPDVLLEGLDPAPGPEARYQSREADSLAFVSRPAAAAEQRAFCCYATCSGTSVSEAAELLGLTEDAVTSAWACPRDDGRIPARPSRRRHHPVARGT